MFEGKSSSSSGWDANRGTNWLADKNFPDTSVHLPPASLTIADVPRLMYVTLAAMGHHSVKVTLETSLVQTTGVIPSYLGCIRVVGAYRFPPCFNNIIVRKGPMNVEGMCKALNPARFNGQSSSPSSPKITIDEPVKTHAPGVSRDFSIILHVKVLTVFVSKPNRSIVMSDVFQMIQCLLVKRLNPMMWRRSVWKSKRRMFRDYFAQTRNLLACSRIVHHRK